MALTLTTLVIAAGVLSSASPRAESPATGRPWTASFTWPRADYPNVRAQSLPGSLLILGNYNAALVDPRTGSVIWTKQLATPSPRSGLGPAASLGNVLAVAVNDDKGRRLLGLNLADGSQRFLVKLAAPPTSGLAVVGERLLVGVLHGPDGLDVLAMNPQSGNAALAYSFRAGASEDLENMPRGQRNKLLSLGNECLWINPEGGLERVPLQPSYGRQSRIWVLGDNLLTFRQGATPGGEEDPEPGDAGTSLFRWSPDAELPVPKLVRRWHFQAGVIEGEVTAIPVSGDSAWVGSSAGVVHIDANGHVSAWFKKALLIGATHGAAIIAIRDSAGSLTARRALSDGRLENGPIRLPRGARFVAAHGGVVTLNWATSGSSLRVTARFTPID
jgi:hypothetical protein